MNDIKKQNNLSVGGDDLLDEELQQILGNRYQDTTHLFTPAAQERRRNNRLIFTARIGAFMTVLMFGMCWANAVGILSAGWYGLGLSLSSIVVGYNAGVCVSHLKGWRD